ncbi:MAG: Uma2 family endonuclease [Pseudonocardiaceae bacterium]
MGAIPQLRPRLCAYPRRSDVHFPHATRQHLSSFRKRRSWEAASGTNRCEGGSLWVPGGWSTMPDLAVVEREFAGTYPTRYPPGTIRAVIEIVSPGSEPQDQIIKPRIGLGTGSGRILTEFAQLDDRLIPWNTVPAVIDFRTALQDTIVHQT